MKVKFDGVIETSLITLYARAEDYKKEKSVLRDKKSAEIFSQIDYDFSKFSKGWLSYYGILSRAKIMDEQVKKFISENPESIVVSIGCGLDTRFERVDNGKVEWYNVDFPEVIEKRKLFFSENERVKNISKSALNPEWTKDIKIGEKKLLIISEGVLMYFSEEEIKSFLKILTDNFDEFEAQFDLISVGALKMQKEHDVLKKMNATFKWGVKDGSEVVKLNPVMKQTGLINFTVEMKKILPFTKKWIIPFMYLYNNRLGMYSYKKEK